MPAKQNRVIALYLRVDNVPEIGKGWQICRKNWQNYRKTRQKKSGNNNKKMTLI
jgi:hypothetical protein